MPPIDGGGRIPRVSMLASCSPSCQETGSYKYPDCEGSLCLGLQLATRKDHRSALHLGSALRNSELQTAEQQRQLFLHLLRLGLGCPVAYADFAPQTGNVIPRALRSRLRMAFRGAKPNQL